MTACVKFNILSIACQLIGETNREVTTEMCIDVESTRQEEEQNANDQRSDVSIQE